MASPIGPLTCACTAAKKDELAGTKSLQRSPFRALELAPSGPHCLALLAYR